VRRGKNTNLRRDVANADQQARGRRSHGLSALPGDGGGHDPGGLVILVISCSLNPESRSRLMAAEACGRFAERNEPVELFDLQDFPLPLCDGSTAYGDPNARRLAELGAAADAVVLSAPVYNFGVSAAAKNVVELSGRAWTGKVVGFLLASGGRGSYMAGMGLANSLMLDFRCLIIPRFVFADGDAFDAGQIRDPEITRRIDELCHEIVRVSRALKATEPS
jgi:NAD(P)H-dependent FMN reductase